MSDFCQVSEHVSDQANENICRWPDSNMPWTLTQLLPGLTEQQMVDLLQPWFSQWRRVKVWYVERAADARVLVGCRAIDGQNGVLADCFLPCGNVRQVRLQFDVGENWTADMLGRVGRHEWGHAGGLGHAPEGSANWMAPYLNKQNEQGEWDAREEKRRYPDVLPPPPDPVPTPTPQPPPGVPGMTLEQLRTMLTNILSVAEFLAKLTPTSIDNSVVAFLQQAVAQDWILELLLKLINSGKLSKAAWTHSSPAC